MTGVLVQESQQLRCPCWRQNSQALSCRCCLGIAPEMTQIQWRSNEQRTMAVVELPSWVCTGNPAMKTYPLDVVQQDAVSSVSRLGSGRMHLTEAGESLLLPLEQEECEDRRWSMSSGSRGSQEDWHLSMIWLHQDSKHQSMRFAWLEMLGVLPLAGSLIPAGTLRACLPCVVIY